MGVTDKIWGALTSIIKLEDKVNRQSDAMKTQQTKIEDLTGRVIRLETQLDMLAHAASINRLRGGTCKVRKLHFKWRGDIFVPTGSCRPITDC